MQNVVTKSKIREKLAKLLVNTILHEKPKDFCSFLVKQICNE